MNPRRFACMVGLALLAVPAWISDAVAARLDAHRWPAIVVPLVALADLLDQCRDRLARAAQGGQP